MQCGRKNAAARGRCVAALSATLYAGVTSPPRPLPAPLPHRQPLNYVSSSSADGPAGYAEQPDVAAAAAAAAAVPGGGGAYVPPVTPAVAPAGAAGAASLDPHAHASGAPVIHNWRLRQVAPHLFQLWQGMTDHCSSLATAEGCVVTTVSLPTGTAQLLHAHQLSLQRALACARPVTPARPLAPRQPAPPRRRSRATCT